jgi:hypothetical protein
LINSAGSEVTVKRRANSEQLTEEVVAELTNDLIKNVHMPDVRCNRAFAGEVSGSSALEAGVWECAHLGPVDVHWNDHWEHRHRKWGE